MDKRECGRYPTATHRQPYCPVCDALEQVPARDNPADDAWVAAAAHTEWDRLTAAVFDRCDRIKALHTAYRARHR